MTTKISTKPLLKSMSLPAKKELVHEHLCFGLSQVYEHRSTAKILEILGNYPNGVNKRRMLKWIELYAPVVLVSEDPLIYKMSEKEVFSFDKAKLFPFWKVVLDTPQDVKLTIKSEATKALNKFFRDPSESNYDKLVSLMTYYKRHSNNPRKRSVAHKPAIHLQAGAPGLKG